MNETMNGAIKSTTGDKGKLSIIYRLPVAIIGAMGGGSTVAAMIIRLIPNKNTGKLRKVKNILPVMIIIIDFISKIVDFFISENENITDSRKAYLTNLLKFENSLPTVTEDGFDMSGPFVDWLIANQSSDRYKVVSFHDLDKLEEVPDIRYIR